MAQQEGVLSQEYRELRTKAKNLFKSGAVPDSFKHIEEVLITFAKTRAAENEEAWFEVMDALILQARLHQEVGDFIKADKALSEVKEILEQREKDLVRINDERVLYYLAKYYHVQAKNYARQCYHQKAYDFFSEGLTFLRQSQTYEAVRIKFTCKLLEGLGHLMCEPLLFDICEKRLDEAEALYDKHAKLFSEHARIRFLIKKSSFLKKYGFFQQSLEQLLAVQARVEELLKEQESPKEALQTKKLLFKVYRDKARLSALKRDEQSAHEYHKKAERILT